jgi:hypothetical protein
MAMKASESGGVGLRRVWDLILVLILALDPARCGFAGF